MAATTTAAGLADATIEDRAGAGATRVAIFLAEPEMILVEHSEAEHLVVFATVRLVTALAAGQRAEQDR